MEIKEERRLKSTISLHNLTLFLAIYHTGYRESYGGGIGKWVVGLPGV